MIKKYLDSTRYICIHYTPSKRAKETILNSLKELKNAIEHPCLHTTILYAPVVNNKFEEALKIISNKTSMNIPKELFYSNYHLTSYNTLSAEVEPGEYLVSLHHNFFSLLRGCLHETYVKQYLEKGVPNDYLEYLHTSNFGKNYSPHMTLGRFESDSSRNRTIELTPSPIKDTVSGLFFSDANSPTLKPIIQIR
ncbi:MULTISPECIES: hypothetical protein [unclassified Maridesulfovibrio]|uniref:hypothetical protein n=1 Tax=unclassified Maridesulfovibrio TaxID=2794999 RepID=UPI003B40A9F3